MPSERAEHARAAGHVVGGIVATLTFLAAWAYCAVEYRSLFDLGLGWVPAGILAATLGAVAYGLTWLLWRLVPIAVGLAILVGIGWLIVAGIEAFWKASGLREPYDATLAWAGISQSEIDNALRWVGLAAVVTLFFVAEWKNRRDRAQREHWEREIESLATATEAADATYGAYRDALADGKPPEDAQQAAEAARAQWVEQHNEERRRKKQRRNAGMVAGRIVTFGVAVVALFFWVPEVDPRNTSAWQQIGVVVLVAGLAVMAGLAVERWRKWRVKGRRSKKVR